MENTKTKLGAKTWVAIVLISLVGQIAWAIENNFFNLYIQDVYGASLTQIALMVALSAIAATLTTLFIGAWSDKIGKRKLFICIGYIIWGITIYVFALMQKWTEHLEVLMGINAATIGVALVIIFDCIMTFFGSTANDACFNAWMTDVSDESNRGKVEGVNSAMPLLAMLIVFGGAMLLPDKNNPNSYNYTALFLIIGTVVIIVGIVSFFLIKDTVKEKNNEPYFKNIFYGFRPSVIKKNAILYVTLGTFCIVSIAVQVFMPYLVLYLRNSMDNYIVVMVPAIVIGAVFTILYGKVIDKLGFVKAIIPLFGLFIAGLVVLTFVTNQWLILVGATLMLSGFLGMNAAFGAMIRDYTPQGQVGMFQGLRITMSVLIPMLVGPFIGSAISSNTGSVAFGVVGDEFTPSSYIFIASAAVSLLAIGGWFAIRYLLKKKDNNKEENKQEVEVQDEK